MTQHGIKILQNTVVKEVERVPEGLQLKLSGEYEEPVIADVILAWSDSECRELGLENAGIDVVPSAIEGPGYSTTNAIAVK